jgi:23S rRNA pseudouridine2605 synthase
VAARRKADLLIVAGRVAVNGEVAQPGRQVDPARDTVTVDGRPARLPGGQTYLVMNKPAGVLTAASDARGRRTVIDLLAGWADLPRLYPVGRLDLDSRGLLLLTDDGELADRLMHPRYHVQKEYRVRLRGRPSATSLARVREGMRVGDERFQPASVTVEGGEGDRSRLTVVLTEGRKREVRRIFQALGHPVLDLERVRLGSLRLGRLQPGSARRLTAAEVHQLRQSVGLG